VGLAVLRRLGELATDPALPIPPLPEDIAFQVDLIE